MELNSGKSRIQVAGLNNYTIHQVDSLPPEGFGEGHCAGCIIRTRLRLLWRCRGQVAG